MSSSRPTRLLRASAGLVLAFLYLPLAALMAFSVNDSAATVWQGFSLRWYRELWQDSSILAATANSLLIALASTLCSTVVGTLAAYALWKQRSRLLLSTVYLSLVTPEVVMGVALLALYQAVFRFLDIRLGMHTVILAHVSFSISYVVLVVLARLRTMDATLEEAAMDLGATELQAFYRVTLPGLAPAIAAAALLAFSISFDDYVITSLVAGVDSETLPMLIYAKARRAISPSVNALCAVIVVVMGSLVLLAQRLQER
ncbi:MAG: ABC transporter permease [Bryobacterales bacterium]|jgi:spermidine/putrescine transport system permease protein|nr:ABC transporter permease [Bryobacterales bacterium]